MIEWFKQPANRAYVYRVVTTLMPLLILTGVLANDVAAEVVLIAAAVLGIGTPALAAANTSTKPEDSTPEPPPVP